MYFETSEGKATKIGYKLNAKGKKVRFSKNSGKELDK